MSARLEPMRLDIVTLTLVSAPIIALQGVLLLYSWSQSREVTALAWWGASFLLVASSLVLLIPETIPSWLSIMAGPPMMFLAFALLWTGFRVFERRCARLPWVLAGPLAWLAICGIPAVYKSGALRFSFASAVVVSYITIAAREVWRGRAEALGSRYPIIGILGLHLAFSVCLALPIDLLGLGESISGQPISRITALHYEILVFAIVMSFLLVNLTKERVEAEQRAIASRDPLTGTLNRRAFLERARDLLDRARRTRQTCALIVADLDFFKSVNDSFGHAAGDQVLQGMSRLAMHHLPAGALMVRLGGEEFGFLLVGTQATASAFAEGMRTGLEATRFETQHEAFSTTVSLGIATTEDVGHILDAMMAAADVALYRAKALGRNRVEITGDRETEANELTEYDRLSLAA